MDVLLLSVSQLLQDSPSGIGHAAKWPCLGGWSPCNWALLKYSSLFFGKHNLGVSAWKLIHKETSGNPWNITTYDLIGSMGRIPRSDLEPMASTQDRKK
jgi:hypothetical protein